MKIKIKYILIIILKNLVNYLQVRMLVNKKNILKIISIFMGNRVNVIKILPKIVSNLLKTAIKEIINYKKISPKINSFQQKNSNQRH
jgi:hypothetical protein